MNGPWHAGRAFAEAHGFSVFVHDLFLARQATAFEAPIPGGVTVRVRAGESDDLIWASLANATLSRDAGFVDETAQSIAGYTRLPGFALWLAERDGVPVGFCHVERRARVGYVQGLGVLGQHESRGIGAALLSLGIDTLRATGVERIELCTENDNVRAQRLYARAGFVLDREAFTYRKKISGV